MEWDEFIEKLEALRVESGAVMVISAPELYGDKIIGLFPEDEASE